MDWNQMPNTYHWDKIVTVSDHCFERDAQTWCCIVNIEARKLKHLVRDKLKLVLTFLHTDMKESFSCVFSASHSTTADALFKSKNTVHCFPPNATDPIRRMTILLFKRLRKYVEGGELHLTLRSYRICCFKRSEREWKWTYYEIWKHFFLAFEADCVR